MESTERRETAEGSTDVCFLQRKERLRAINSYKSDDSSPFGTSAGR
jgi:hypothetical protein